MKLIALTGKKRSGKDTIAARLDFHFWQPVAFADKLKEAAQLIFDLKYEQVNGTTEEKETIDPRWGKSGRQICQLIGSEVGRTIHSEVWIRSAFIHAEKAGYEKVIITDCRFLNEADAVRTRGGIIIKVERPGLVSTDTHISELEIDKIIPDILLINDGTIEDLWRKVDMLLPFIEDDDDTVWPLIAGSEVE